MKGEPGDLIKSRLRGAVMPPEQTIHLPTDAILPPARVTIRGINTKQAPLCMAARFACYFAQLRGIRYAHVLVLSYLVCLRMASTILVAFHPTTSVAIEDISTGILSAPHGLIAIIGRPICCAVSTSYCIHFLWL